jgi:uncharacterized protein YdaU (DUF1376 family)
MADSDLTPGRAPAFQFYPNDFLADANVAVMSMQERGVYITLICFCWQQGSLPCASERLAALCGVPVATFRKFWPAIEPCFKRHANGDRFVHPRLEKERKKQRDYRKKQAENGRLGGRPKNPPLSSGKPNGLHDDKPKESSSSSVFGFQTAVGAPPRERIRKGNHGSHAMCGVVCFPSQLWTQWLPRVGDDPAKLRTWVAGVLEHWQGVVDSGGSVPEGDDFAFWRARWSESHAAAKPAPAPDRHVESADETAKLLEERRKWVS